MIRENQKITVERTVCTCDRCGREMTQQDHSVEWAERFFIRFRGGYGSEFGDGSIVEGDFCQHCIYQLLGRYCRVKTDDPFQPEHVVAGDPEKICQPHQLDDIEEINAVSDAFRFIVKRNSPG